jgi:hypothetical protein
VASKRTPAIAIAVRGGGGAGEQTPQNQTHFPRFLPPRASASATMRTANSIEP